MNFDAVGSGIVAVIMAIIGVAVIAVLVSKQAQTANVLTAAGSSFAGVLGAAESPVTGSSTLGNLGLSLLGS